jgi:thiosulfate dehydrogenase [quinone] large subunit
MKSTKTFTTFQLTVMVLLRILIGWHLLYEGISKLSMPEWSSALFLSDSQWILSGLADWIISNSGVLSVVDFLNTWGLIAIGTGLILGLLTRVAAYAGTLLLFVYYLNNIPLIGVEYNMPAEGNYLIVSKTLIEAAALLVLAVFQTGSVFGLDILLARNTKSKNGE